MNILLDSAYTAIIIIVLVVLIIICVKADQLSNYHKPTDDLWDYWKVHFLFLYNSIMFIYIVLI